jgi:hypothetical protein
MSKDFSDDVDDPHVGGKLYKIMRTLFHLCTAISPLFALSSCSYDGSYYRRDNFIMVGEY